MFRRARIAAIAPLLLGLSAAGQEDRLDLRQRDYLFGDWGGARTRLAERGIEGELVYTSELLWNVHGGLDTGSEYRADLSLTLSLDTERLGWWRGGEFFAHLQAQHGDGLTETRVGDFQVMSNIDDEDFAQVSELWYRHTFADGRFWIKAGKQETNEDFAFVEHGGEFINSSPGFSPTIPLVTYPDQDWGVAIGFAPADWFSVNAGVFQGRPDGSRSVGDTLDTLHGPMIMIEPAIHYDIAGQPGHLRLGVWWNGDRFAKLGIEAEDESSALEDRLALIDSIRTRGLAVTYIEGLLQTALGLFGDALIDRVDGSETDDDAHGYYATWDQRIYREADDEQGLGIFAQYGHSDEDVFEAEHYYGIGAEWTGLIRGRDEDVLGLGAFHANFSERGGFEKGGETAVELFYRAQLTPWISLKPDVQYINHPGGQDDHAWVIGFRTEIGF